MRQRRGYRVSMLGIVLLVCAQGCKTNTDAVAAAQQMAVVASALTAYYSGLEALVDANESVQKAQFYINGVPADTTLEQTRSELEQREKLAAAFAKVSGLMGDLTGSTASADVTKAVDGLNSELTSLHAYSLNGNETSALNMATTALVNAIKAHDEVKAARASAQVTSAMSNFFDAEKDTYVSFADSYYVTAASNAKALIKNSAGTQVAPDDLFATSLQPFGLTARITDPKLLSAAQPDLSAKVDQGLTNKRKADAKAADDLSLSMHVMNDRIDKVMHDRALSASVPPFTLQGVMDWVKEVKTDLGVN